MPRRYRVAVLGGTFDRLHVGHRALLARAFRRADRVGIGVTTPTYLGRHAKPLRGLLEPYRRRRARLLGYLHRTYPRREFWLAPLNEPFGGSVAPGVDLLVVSKETLAGARAVNAERRRRGLPPVDVEAIDPVRADDGLPVSSRRVRAGAIDAEGRRRRPVVVELFAPPETEPDDVVRAFRSELPSRSRRRPEVRVRTNRRGARPPPGRGRPARRPPVPRRGGADFVVAVGRAGRDGRVEVRVATPSGEPSGSVSAAPARPGWLSAAVRRALRRALGAPSPRRGRP